MNRIKKILKQQGRSQAWLAEQIHRSYVVTTNYCNNKTQPSIPILRKIAIALDVDIRELLDGNNEGILNLIFRGSDDRKHTVGKSKKAGLLSGTGKNVYSHSVVNGEGLLQS
jgi:putative transcriptional regulator